MAMTISGLAEAMKASTLNKTNPDGSILHDLGVAIGDYIVSNAELMFSWSANCPGDTTEQTTPNGEIISHNITLTYSYTDQVTIGINYLANEIYTDIKSTMYYNITELGYTTTQQVMSDIPVLTLTMIVTDVRNNAYLQLATQIYNWITAYVPGTPCPGTHGTCVGTGSVTSIS